MSTGTASSLVSSPASSLMLSMPTGRHRITEPGISGSGIITNTYEEIIFTIDSYKLKAKKTECLIKGSWAQSVAGEPENVVWQFDDLLECIKLPTTAKKKEK